MTLEAGDRRTFYGRRKGKPLRPMQEARLTRLLPSLRFDPEKLAAERPKILEIGFGGGEHLASEAKRLPDVQFIGCEPFLNGVAKLLARIEAEQLDNVLVHPGEAADVLASLPAECVDVVYLLYPDPWPKSRHHKRRFVSEESLQALAHVLAPNGELRFATDIDDYSAWTLSTIFRTNGFRWKAECAADWLLPWEGWLGTRYEEKARREGRSSSYLTFIKNPD